MSEDLAKKTNDDLERFIQYQLAMARKLTDEVMPVQAKMAMDLAELAHVILRERRPQHVTGPYR